LRRADRSSISSFHLADLGGEAIDIDVQCPSSVGF
jgi:hypothetical protein